MRKLLDFHKALGRLEFAVTAFLTLAMVTLVVLAVIMRYAIGSPLVFSFDLSTLLFAWMVFLGLALAERDGVHLAVDILDGYLPPRARKTLRIMRKILVLAVSAATTWFGWKLFQRAGMTIPSMRISIGWLYASLPIGFALLTLAQAVKLLQIATDPAEDTPC